MAAKSLKTKYTSEMPLVLSVGGKILSNMRATGMAAFTGDWKESCPRTHLVSAFSTVDPQQDKVEVVAHLCISSGITYSKREEKGESVRNDPASNKV